MFRHTRWLSLLDVTTDQRHALGVLGEELAARHLERLGYEIVARRHRTRFGEIDVIARDRATLVFVEVKARRPGPTSPYDGIDAAKQAQVRRMGVAYLHDERPPFSADVRFDAIAVTIDGAGKLVALEHLEGAF